MRISFIAGAAFTALLTTAANATMPPIPPPAPALTAKAKVFNIAPKDQEQDFMCEAGHVLSVVAISDHDNGLVPVVLIDAQKNAIPDGVWASASGFRFAKKIATKVNVTFICGN